MIPEINYIPFESVYGYNESTQTIALRYAFLNKQGNDYREMFLPVMCRDYLNDILHWEYYDLPKGDICGFSYNSKKQKIDRDKIRLSLQCSSLSAFKNLHSNLFSILTPVEKENGFEPSTIFRVSPKISIIEGDAKWLSSIFLLSSYTLLLRLSGGSFKNPMSWQQEMVTSRTGDTVFCTAHNQAWLTLLPHLGKIHDLMKEKEIPPSGFGIKAAINDVHFYAGILGTFEFKANNLLSPVLKEIIAS